MKWSVAAYSSFTTDYNALLGWRLSSALTASVAFYPTVMIVIASYYVLFAAMRASRRTLVIEIAIASAFLLVAVQDPLRVVQRRGLARLLLLDALSQPTHFLRAC
jgi:hypothetical protein